MDVTEAMEVISQAGRGAEAAEIVEKASSAAQARYRQVQDDDTRTPEFQREEMGRIYEESREDLAGRLSTIAASCRQSGNRDAGQVFGIDGLKGDPASLSISRRDAVDRVASAHTREELMRLLDDATRSGDEVLARAVAARAMENQDADTLNAFTADRPDLEGPIQRLWDTQRRGQQDRARRAFGHTLALSGLRPPEMSRR